MCLAFDARPPELPVDLALPPLAGGAGAEILELTSEDGTRFSAALAESPSASPEATGVVILPDVRGLYRFYLELAERFAQAGHHAIAIDYFGRTAGTGERDADFDFWPHVERTSVEQVQADAAAAIQELRERTGVEAVVTVGFCFGGLHSFLAATSAELDLAGVVGFYGALDGTRLGAPSPPDHTGDMRCPVLGLFGGADAGIPLERVDAFERGMAAAGVEHEVVTYPGAPHSFFDRSFEEHAEACTDAWRRVLGFLERVGAPVAR
ncbi:MAG: carboxymethylenebutenolidase [Solirubrobacteraceae bacterium]|jgi:carboxymethylenebutenolidase|nr:carboxymethylenebutenolidase [Solirubrobacteraceae bacterium]